MPTKAGKPAQSKPKNASHANSPVPLAFARTLAELATETELLRRAPGKIALVPTMGALHEGHLALVSKAREMANHTIVSVFVNPAQFAPNEDLQTYPRDEAADEKALAEAGVDLVWAPNPAIMYPENFATQVVPKGAAQGLETVFRPHFFTGVATVVLKLFNQVKPDIAVFGEKDYQQLCVVRQMVRDLNLPVEIIGTPTVREPDGLALSSRNAYLSARERAIAPVLHEVLNEFAQAVSAEGNSSSLRADARTKLLAEGFNKIDYIDACDGQTLAPIERIKDRPGRALGAAWLGTTRLIDNVPILAPDD